MDLPPLLPELKYSTPLLHHELYFCTLLITSGSKSLKPTVRFGKNATSQVDNGCEEVLVSSALAKNLDWKWRQEKHPKSCQIGWVRKGGLDKPLSFDRKGEHNDTANSYKLGREIELYCFFLLNWGPTKLQCHFFPEGPQSCNAISFLRMRWLDPNGGDWFCQIFGSKESFSAEKKMVAKLDFIDLIGVNMFEYIFKPESLNYFLFCEESVGMGRINMLVFVLEQLNGIIDFIWFQWRKIL